MTYDQMRFVTGGDIDIKINIFGFRRELYIECDLNIQWSNRP